MIAERVVILDGTSGQGDEGRIVAAVRDVADRSFAGVRSFNLREERIAHCIGCFGCWVETPGECRANDRGRDVIAAVVRADTLVLVTPVTFGGYSSTLKRAVDHFVQMALPYFRVEHGELHHPLRYGRFPRLVVFGIQSSPDAAEAELFRALVTRNVINFHSPSHATDVLGGNDSQEHLRARVEAALVGTDEGVPLERVRALIPEPTTGSEVGTTDRHALVLVGSPKTKTPSTSGVLGRHLLSGLQERGWTGEVLTVTAAVRDEGWCARMLATVDSADLVILAFPLYIDALPALLTRVLERIAEHRRGGTPARPQRLAVVVNNGFPEAHQNLPALAICARFAAAAGMVWAGGLAMGAGEALLSGRPLTGVGSASRPPVDHVIAALDLTATALAAGEPVPERAEALIARTPIPLVPFSVWRRLFMFMAGRYWHRLAAGHGVSRGELMARPFAPV